MKNFKMVGDITTTDFLKEINKDSDVTLCCCNCGHRNGECVDFAKAGTCKAYNFYKSTKKNNRM